MLIDVKMNLSEVFKSWVAKCCAQLRIPVSPGNGTYMSVAQAAHVTVRLSQDMGRQLYRRVASKKNTSTDMAKQQHQAAMQNTPWEPL